MGREAVNFTFLLAFFLEVDWVGVQPAIGRNPTLEISDPRYG